MSDEIVDAVDTEETNVDEAEVEAPVDGAEALGDPGKKALDTMKAQRKAANDRAKVAEAERDALKAQLEGREAEHAAEQEKQRTKDEALAAANKRILGAELKAAAKGKLADPTDASLYINLDDFDVSDEGDVDSDALSTAIDELLARKPHLAAGAPRRFDGGADQGAGGTATKVRQLTDADLESMTPAQINDARKKGLLNKLLGVPTP